MPDKALFTGMDISGSLVMDLRRMNPWWEGKPLPVLPTTRRHMVAAIHRRLQSGLAPIVVLRGPRQIGKSTAQMHVIEDLLGQGTPANRILRVQCDELSGIAGLGPEPVLRIVDWYENAVLSETINSVARAGGAVYLLLDEVQNLRDWDVQLKFLVDHTTLKVVVTGSSALRIEQGRDSLAGRITTIEGSTLSLTEIGQFHGMGLGEPLLADNGLEPLVNKQFWRDVAAEGQARASPRDAAFALFSERGGYPVAHRRPMIAWPQVADQLNETVVRRVIQHDLRVGDRGRKRDPALLEALFTLACRYVGQAPDVETLSREVQRVLAANVGTQRILHYMRFLGDTLLLRLVGPLEIRLKRKRGFPKVCLADHALRASWLQEVVPLDATGLQANPHLTSLAGHVAESVVGATLMGIHGLDVAYLPSRRDQPEIDFVITVGTRRVPIEVKYQRRIDPMRDTEALRTFIETAVNNAPFGVLVTQTDGSHDIDARIVSVPLSSLMLLR